VNEVADIVGDSTPGSTPTPPGSGTPTPSGSGNIPKPIGTIDTPGGGLTPGKSTWTEADMDILNDLISILGLTVNEMIMSRKNQDSRIRTLKLETSTTN
jgi:hypothetical protein